MDVTINADPRKSTNGEFGARISDLGLSVGIVVDASPRLGYGHAVRCLRLGHALEPEVPVTFYPMSEACESFLRESSSESEIRKAASQVSSLPPVVITDLHEPNGITAGIRRNGSRHISIHDLGLAQCRSNVAIDGSVTRLFPYAQDNERMLYAGPQYMITRDPVARRKGDDTVLVTVGGGSTAAAADKIAHELWNIGLKPLTTRGFVGSTPMGDAELADAMATCRFAISGSGVTLYDLLASGVPTIAVAFDRIQLRTAAAFHECGAVLSAGMWERATENTLLKCCLEMLQNRSLVQRMTETGRMLVDGKGLSRVVEIVKKQLWLTKDKTCTA